MTDAARETAVLIQGRFMLRDVFPLKVAEMQICWITTENQGAELSVWQHGFKQVDFIISNLGHAYIRCTMGADTSWTEPYSEEEAVRALEWVDA